MHPPEQRAGAGSGVRAQPTPTKAISQSGLEPSRAGFADSRLRQAEPSNKAQCTPEVLKDCPCHTAVGRLSGEQALPTHFQSVQFPSPPPLKLKSTTAPRSLFSKEATQDYPLAHHHQTQTPPTNSDSQLGFFSGCLSKPLTLQSLSACNTGIKGEWAALLHFLHPLSSSALITKPSPLMPSLPASGHLHFAQTSPALLATLWDCLDMLLASLDMSLSWLLVQNPTRCSLLVAQA